MGCRKAFWRCDEVISMMWRSRRVFDRGFRRSVHYRGPHEENLPAQEAVPPPRARIPSPDEQQRRRARHSEPPPQGSPPADQVAGRPLKRRFRLRRKSDFDAAMQGKRFYSGRGLLALAVPNDGPQTRIGVTVSRQLKGAVDRNRARRRVREAARVSLFERDSGAQHRGIRYDVVLIARPAALTLRFADLKEETEQAALRLTERPQ